MNICHKNVEKKNHQCINIRNTKKRPPIRSLYVSEKIIHNFYRPTFSQAFPPTRFLTLTNACQHHQLKSQAHLITCIVTTYRYFVHHAWFVDSVVFASDGLKDDNSNISVISLLVAEASHAQRVDIRCANGVFRAKIV